MCLCPQAGRESVVENLCFRSKESRMPQGYGIPDKGHLVQVRSGKSSWTNKALGLKDAKERDGILAGPA